jgi:hypothetical protein
MSILQANGAGLGGAGDPGGALAGGGGFSYPHTVSQSLRLNGTNANLSINFGSSSTSTAKRTFSTWIKTCDDTFSSYDHIFGAGSSNIDGFGFSSGSKLEILRLGANTYTGTRVIRDTTAWYHLFFSWDSTNSMYLFYVNGELDSSGNANAALTKLGNSGNTNTIGKRSNAGQYIDGYLAETVFLDGYIANVTDFGEYSNGIWVPKDISDAGFTYGNNGFYLTYKSSDLNTSGSSIADPYGSATNQSNNTFADNSGQGNHWTINNITADDIVPDSPTNNWCILNLLDSHAASTYNDGNLTFKDGGGDGANAHSTMVIPEISDTDTYYAEVRVNAAGYAWGITPVRYSGAHTNTDRTGMLTVYYNGRRYNGSTAVDAANYDYCTPAVGDIFGIKAGNGKLEFFQNGTSLGDAFTSLSGTYKFGCWAVGAAGTGITWNFGQDSTFSNQETAGTTTDKNGRGLFNDAEAANNIALCAANIAKPTIGPESNHNSDYYSEPITYTGTGYQQHIGSGGLQHPQDVTTISNSLRLNDDDTSYLSVTYSDAGTSTAIGTFSFWVKRGELGGSQDNIYFEASGYGGIQFRSDKLSLNSFDSNNTQVIVQSDTTIKDTSKWYHCVVAINGTNGTVKFYIDGVETSQTVSVGSLVSGRSWDVLSYDSRYNFYISSTSSANCWDGYLADYYYIDGQELDATSFGQLGSNGYWIPKTYSGTYGDNGFHLDFSDNSTASALGTDSSGNANNFSVTSVETTDQMGDSPTQNFVTLGYPGRDHTGSPAIREGNLQAYDSSTAAGRTAVKIPKTGKWYFEAKVTSGAGVRFGVADESVSPNVTNFMGTAGTVAGNYYVNSNSSGTSINAATGAALDGGSSTFSGTILTKPVGVFVNMDDREISFLCDRGSGLETIGPFTLSHDELHAGYNMNGDEVTFNFGQDSTFAGNELTGGSNASDANSAGSFFYTVPTDALALMDDNFPVDGIDAPDMVWIKNRSNARHGILYDTIRGPNNDLRPNGQAAEDATVTNQLLSFDKQGFTVGEKNNINGNKETIVAWTWKAGGVPTVDNSAGAGAVPTAGSVKIDGANMTGTLAGTIAATRLSANTTAGFSIVGYTGTGSAATVAHGLSSAPEMVVVKQRSGSSTANWFVYHKDAQTSGAKVFYFNLTNGPATSTPIFNNTQPTDTVFSLGTGNSNNAHPYIAYCWHSVEGFSKVGDYNGTGNAQGGFVYTGFRPALVIIKAATGSTDWCFYDSQRLGYNVDNNLLRPCAGTAATEQTDDDVDFVANGFKFRRNSTNFNPTSAVLYLAFAEAPFKYANAR